MMLHRPKDVCTRLGISASALRLWSDRFGELLSPAAQRSQTETGGAAQRRYTDEDLTLLLQVKAHLAQNKTYEETLELLRTTVAEPAPEVPEAPRTDELALAGSLDEHPVLIAFREALAAKDETIRVLQAQITELKERPLPAPAPTPVPVRFRWGFLNWLLTGNEERLQ